MNHEIYPVLPLRDIVIYPQVIMPLFVGREMSINALDAAMKSTQELLLIPQINPKTQDPSQQDLNPIGTVGRIVQLAKLSDGTIKVLIEGIKRARIDSFTENTLFLEAYCSEAPEQLLNMAESEIQAMISSAIDKFKDYLKTRDKSSDELIETLKGLSDIGRIADTITAHMDIDMQKRIDILSLLDVVERLQQTLVLLAEESEKSQIDEIIRNRVKQQMERNQREYYLNEQMKAIQKELGEMDDVLNDIEQIEQDIENAAMPPEAEKKAQSELGKLRQMPPMSSEATVIRGYLEWMTNYPWAKKTRSQYNLSRAEKILNRDHFGLHDVKERILEHLAVQKRTNGNHKGSIICLVGPPGVGKTSLGKSIAEATGRRFDRISLGGVHDEGEIRGHRRTYIGALPGKIVQKLCKLGSNNPVILLDEIDKMGMDHRGDPASALLEVLDPSQNTAFSDHYLETDIDLSHVLFIATANTLNIPTPLLDRMEVIRIPGYTTREKVEIAHRYILPKQIKDNGLTKREFKVQDNVVEDIIENYTREAGVRHLERELGKLARKSVRKLFTHNRKSIHITSNNLEDYLGVAKFQRSKDDLSNKIGCVNGLAWTSVGGELLQIETVCFPGKGKLNLTGQMGDVMKESVQAALSVVRGIINRTSESFHFNDYDIHMHLPEGATPKDGPSAGIGMATALLSAFTQIPVRGDIAMTGEITLHGRVLAIGGLKEKLLAAVRSQLSTVLIPEENTKDLADIPEEVKSALNIIPVRHIDEVLKQALEASPLSLSERITAQYNTIPTAIHSPSMHSTQRC